MNRKEFEERYAKRSGITVEQLHKLGRYGYPCLCGDISCEGWQMVNENDFLFYSPRLNNDWEEFIKEIMDAFSPLLLKITNGIIWIMEKWNDYFNSRR
jgi:hypothetical protein